MVTQNTFDIFSWNVRGINGYKKRRKIFNWMVKHSSVNSIFMLQETHSTRDDEKNWRKQWRGKLFFSYRTSNSTGVLVGFREGLDYSVIKIELEKVYDHITEGIILRSRAQWYEGRRKIYKLFS